MFLHKHIFYKIYSYTCKYVYVNWYLLLFNILMQMYFQKKWVFHAQRVKFSILQFLNFLALLFTVFFEGKYNIPMCSIAAKPLQFAVSFFFATMYLNMCL